MSGKNTGEARRRDSDMYLVGYGEAKLEDRKFAIVEASGQDEAIRKFVREVAVKDDLWLETVYDRAINMSFAESFWIQTQEDKARFREGPPSPTDKETFNQRVRDFFGEHKQFAELYLEFYWGDQPVEFPTEMLVYMYVNSDWSDVIALPFRDIRKIDY